MKIGMVTQWYDPETGSATIPAGIARALARAGHDVHVVTGFPNYPHGRLYDGYTVHARHTERIGDVTVSRVLLYPSHDRSAIRRMVNFVSFMVSSATIGAFTLRKVDVVLVYSTPGTVGLAGMVLRRLMGKRFVLYVADLWPDTLAATGMLPRWLMTWVEPALHVFCDAVYAASDRILVISPGMRDRIVARGVPRSKVEVVYNWVDESVFTPVSRPHTRSAGFEVMYAGNLGDVQGLETAIEAISLLPTDSGIVLRFVGSGVAQARLETLAARLGVAHRVCFEPPQPATAMSALMASADIQLVSLKDHPLFHITMPSKIQATLASAQPVILSAPGDAARLIDSSGAGWSVPVADARALAAAMLRASRVGRAELDHMAALGRQYYDRHLSSAVGVEKMMLALERAQAKDHPHAA